MATDTPNTTTNTSNVVHFNPVTQFPIKLSGSHNFAIWKKQFSMLLNGHRIYGHLDGSKPLPPATILQGTAQVHNPAHDIWLQQDQLIQHAMMASVEAPLAPCVAAADSAKLAWDALHTSFASCSQTRIYSLRDHLYRITKDSSALWNTTIFQPLSGREKLLSLTRNYSKSSWTMNFFSNMRNKKNQSLKLQLLLHLVVRALATHSGAEDATPSEGLAVAIFFQLVRSNTTLL